ncbi:hypothetical protein [Gluconacetobacter tumulicola]|uniref:Uncharacterized protein n=1 Tax=Gluconacetobacter tumulicola TaxID=1017177 RepID=A0A7W4JEI8_9PROT|nr:hypothetical protein [Gluconacetobacter tumulicola]
MKLRRPYDISCLLVAVFPYLLNIGRIWNTKCKLLLADEILQRKAEGGFITGRKPDPDTVMPGKAPDKFLDQVPDILRMLEGLRWRKIKGRPQGPRIDRHADTRKTHPLGQENRHAQPQDPGMPDLQDFKISIGGGIHPPFFVERIGMIRIPGPKTYRKQDIRISIFFISAK